MNYALQVREHNIPVHLDIEKAIAGKANGQFTFTIRVHEGNIVDLNIVEYVDARHYLSLKDITLTELSITPNNK